MCTRCLLLHEIERIVRTMILLSRLCMELSRFPEHAFHFCDQPTIWFFCRVGLMSHMCIIWHKFEQNMPKGNEGHNKFILLWVL